MYITKEELEKRLKKTELRVITRNRKERGEENRLSNEERTIVGILSELDTQKDVAEMMGVSQTTVSNNSRGLVSVPAGVNKELKEGIEKGKEDILNERKETEKKIQEQLVANLAAALGHVGNNVTSTKATEASKIAVDMARILDSVNGNNKEHKTNRTAIIINVPAMKEEKNYEIIDV